MSRRKQSKSKTVLVRVARNKVMIGPGGVVKVRIPKKRRNNPNSGHFSVRDSNRDTLSIHRTSLAAWKAADRRRQPVHVVYVHTDGSSTPDQDPRKWQAKKNPCAWKRPTIWKRKKTAPNKRRKSVARTPKRRSLKAKPRRAPAKKTRRRR
jgi:hypothetical protein